MWCSLADAIASSNERPQTTRRSARAPGTIDTGEIEVEIRGVRLPAGSKVALWYPSANRDEAVFPAPHRFDVTRTFTRPQVSYGGGGPHFCLGANLARREIVVMFDEIRRRAPELLITGEPERPVSMALNAIRSVSATIR